jgi:hypothetical protein
MFHDEHAGKRRGHSARKKSGPCRPSGYAEDEVKRDDNQVQEARSDHCTPSADALELMDAAHDATSATKLSSCSIVMGFSRWRMLEACSVAS